MSTRPDPLEDRDLRPDRLHYATGALLDREDFLAEQLYHRGRMARAMASLHGSGTVAGLRVRVEPLGDGEDLLRVLPGLAVDRMGRLVEVPRSACLRLGRWMSSLEGERIYAARKGTGVDSPIALYGPGPDDLQHDPTEEQQDRAEAIATQKAVAAAGSGGEGEEGSGGLEGGEGGVDEPGAPGGGPGTGDALPEPEWKDWNYGYVVADVFLAFAACERGKTPAFATGPYDALDAVAPSRVRDGYTLTLALREHTLVPGNPWATVSGAGAVGRLRAAERQMMDAGWPDATAEWDDRNTMRPADEHPPEVDPSSVFLARLFIPLAAGFRKRDPGFRVLVNNHLRSFVYPGPALAWLATR
jgi:hypothetical protein